MNSVFSCLETISLYRNTFVESGLSNLIPVFSVGIELKVSTPSPGEIST